MATVTGEYLVDTWQCSILTWNLLRQRGNQYLEHQKSGKSADYALVRIKPPAGCPAPMPTKRPFVVIDSRGGHGQRIGGLKMYLGREERVADERPFNLLRQLIKQARPEKVPSLAAVKAAVKRQAFVLAMDGERALAALPQLVPDMEERRRGYQGARIVVSARGTPTPYQEERFRRVAQVLGLDNPARVRKLA